MSALRRAGDLLAWLCPALALTPQFFANKPLDLLFREGIEAESSTLQVAVPSMQPCHGCDLLFQELALRSVPEGIDRFNHLDTTSFSLTGDYVPDSDEPPSHYPGLPKTSSGPKQALELMVLKTGCPL